jgi:hypothetical protein
MKKMIALFLILVSSLTFAGNSGIEVVNPLAYKRVVAISDVHGMYDELITLLKAGEIIDADKHWIGQNTLLIIAGDSIDKGPHSLDVIDLWRSLNAEATLKGGHVAFALGNHEAQLLADHTGTGINPALAQEIAARGLSYDQLVSPDSNYGSYLRSLPGFVSVGKWIFFHAGLIPPGDFKATLNQVTEALQKGDYQNDIIIGQNSFLEQKDWWQNDLEGNLTRLTQAGYFGVVFGHKPTAFGAEGKITFVKNRIFKIDSGMPPQSGSHPGEMLVFESPMELLLDSPPQQAFAIQSDGIKRPLH